jgi:LuxR family maltose regulon positive regulatory protein
VIGHHPQILIAKGWALTLEGAVRQVGPLLEQAEAQAKEGYETPTGGELAGFAAAIRAFLAMMAGEDAQALALAERAEALLPESSVHARWLLPYTMGAAYRGQGQYEKAVEAFEQQARMGEAHDNLIVWATGVTGAAIVRRVQGRLRETGEICRQALQRVAEMGAAQSGSLAKLETPLIEALREQNELEEAEQRLADVMGRMRTWPMPTDRLHASLAQIEVQEARGDLTGAFETLRAAKDLIARQPVLINLKRSVALAEIRLLLKSGNLATAERLMEALQPGTSRWVELREQEFILLARLRLAQGRPDEAERILAPLIIEAEAGERPGVLIESLSLSALAGYEQGNLEPALRVLKKALSLAEPEGYVRVFVDEGDRMRAMLAAVRRQQGKAPPSKAYLAKLLEAFGDQTAPAPGSLIQGEVDGLVEPLTARELEVLQLLAAGGSNRAIAEKLVITVSAVKKHCANLYGKLGVNSRTQAVARARQLEILPMN